MITKVTGFKYKALIRVRRESDNKERTFNMIDKSGISGWLQDSRGYVSMISGTVEPIATHQKVMRTNQTWRSV